MTQIIGLGFKARTGKDTTGDYLVKFHGWQKMAFADAVKEQARAIFGFTDEQLYGDKKEVIDEYWNKHLKLWDINLECFNCDSKSSTIVSEVPSHYPCGRCAKAAIWMQREGAAVDILQKHKTHVGWIKQLPITPRVILQYSGTQMGRGMLHPDIWILSLMRKTEQADKNVVITDVRFPNEAMAILQKGGRVFRIDRPDASTISGQTAHISETAMNDFKYWSGVLDNSGSFQHLWNQIDEGIINVS